MEEINYKNVDAIKAKISEKFGPFGKQFTVTQEIINQFADLTDDHSWIHVDVEKCKQMSPFGGPIAHGFLTLVLLPRLTAPEPEFKIVGFNTIVNYGSDKLRFPGPVPAGSKIHMCTRIANVEAKPKGTAVTMETAVHVVGQDRPAVIYQMIMLYM